MKYDEKTGAAVKFKGKDGAKVGVTHMYFSILLMKKGIRIPIVLFVKKWFPKKNLEQVNTTCNISTVYGSAIQPTLVPTSFLSEVPSFAPLPCWWGFWIRSINHHCFLIRIFWKSRKNTQEKAIFRMLSYAFIRNSSSLSNKNNIAS